MLLLADWYDYPQYVDLLFRDQTHREAAFVEAAAERFLRTGVVARSARSTGGMNPPAHPGPLRILEMGCGGGRLVCELARRGHAVTGLDISKPALAYLRRRLARRGLTARLLHADMVDFRLGESIDVALSGWSTFRHLLTEEAARSHLRCVADALVRGGLFMLGLHLLPPDADEEDEERWAARHGVTRVHATLRVLATNRKRRTERLRLALRVRGPGRDFRLRSEFFFRLYSPAQFRRFLARQRWFEVAGVYDYGFDLAASRRLDNTMSDTVVVLRRL